MFPFAILLPTTSKFLPKNEIFLPLSKIAKNLIDNQSKDVPLRVYLGIDKGDVFLSQENQDYIVGVVFSGVETTIIEISPEEPAKICSIWRTLAVEAMKDKCKYFILFGDDVDVQCENDEMTWPESIHRIFTDSGNDTPFFGCVALNDVSSPGFPTFPVVTDIHMNIFDNVVVPEEFINQGGDPYIFALYRRFGAARFASDIKMTNDVGGVQLLEDDSYCPPRYERRHIFWQGDILQSGVEQVSSWISDEGTEYPQKANIKSSFVLDIIVPSYRVCMDFVEPIVNLKAPNNCSVMTIVIVDDPDADIRRLRELERSDALLGKLRVRKNLTNQGASISRNVGLEETSADWVLFLDDDVVPGENLLHHYMQSVEENGLAYDGFVGVTELPSDRQNGVFGTAVHLSGVSFFWTRAAESGTTPWGITANLLFNRSGSCHNLQHPPIGGANERGHNVDLRFDSAFIKTGGGEDIDFCLRLGKNTLQGTDTLYAMKCVPEAKCRHPWWHGGARCYGHFFRWAYGDSLLIDKYPHLSYYNFPNVVEVTVGLVVCHVSQFGWNHVGVLVATVVVLLLSDCIFDIHKLFTVEGEKQAYAAGVFRALAAAESCLIKNASEVGHLVGPLSRGQLRVLQRFDWFCGTFSGFIPLERERAARRCAWFVVVISFVYFRMS